MSPRWESNPNIRKGRTVAHALHAHLVFTPKYRRGPFTDEILRRCEEVMRSVCADFETELVEFNGERDHVHLLVQYPPKVALSKLVGSLKGSPLDACARSSPTTSVSTCGARTSGHRPTSPHHAEAHRSASSRNTSRTRSGQTDRHDRTQRMRFLPGVNAQGSSQDVAESVRLGVVPGMACGPFGHAPPGRGHSVRRRDCFRT